MSLCLRQKAMNESWYRNHVLFLGVSRCERSRRVEELLPLVCHETSPVGGGGECFKVLLGACLFGSTVLNSAGGDKKLVFRVVQRREPHARWALIVRIGFWGIIYYNYNKEPQDSKAPVV